MVHVAWPDQVAFMSDQNIECFLKTGSRNVQCKSKRCFLHQHSLVLLSAQLDAVDLESYNQSGVMLKQYGDGGSDTSLFPASCS